MIDQSPPPQPSLIDAILIRLATATTLLIVIGIVMGLMRDNA